MNPILDAPVTSDRNLQYAGFWIRVVALIIYAIILCFGIGILFLVFGTAVLLSGSVFLVLIGYLALIAMGAAYFVLMESSSNQATIGKMAVGIRVGDELGNRISFANSLGRYFSKYLSGIILYIGYIMVAFDVRKQGLHDKIASTVVYYR